VGSGLLFTSEGVVIAEPDGALGLGLCAKPEAGRRTARIAKKAGFIVAR
jgi:hypothetical protein